MTERQNLNDLNQEQKGTEIKQAPPLRNYSSSDYKQPANLNSSSDQENDNSNLLNGCTSPDSGLAAGQAYILNKKDQSLNTARSIDVQQTKSTLRLNIAGASSKQTNPLLSTQKFRQSPSNNTQLSAQSIL